MTSRIHHDIYTITCTAEHREGHYEVLNDNSMQNPRSSSRVQKINAYFISVFSFYYDCL